ncbi:MAG: hypothetical protein ACO2ZK_07655, partial [Gemmobacter sp.]
AQKYAAQIGKDVAYNYKTFKDVNREYGKGDWNKIGTVQTPSDGFLSDLARHKAQNPAFGIEAVHFFPLGGIGATTDWVRNHTGAAGAAD